LKQPTVSAREIAFLYAGDLWIAPLGTARGRAGSFLLPHRLTAQPGRKSNPFFSPDGEWIAFSANYDGSTSVYVLPRTGGMPRRLTYHPYADGVRGWTPDGSRILFASALQSISGRANRLFTVPLSGGMPEPLPMDMAERGAYAPDGARLAYTAYGEAFWSWKRYRGGMTVPIRVLDLATYDHVVVPHENASDTFPCWAGEALYFLSDRRGVMNVFRWKTGASGVEQVTFHEDFDVRSLRAGGGRLTYEQGGRIHLFDPAAGQVETLRISAAADLPSSRPRFQKLARSIQSAGISPTGQRAVFAARGEIFTVPAKKGDVRNLTKTPGVMERDPAWAPDGQSLAYFSDASGEYGLVVCDQKGVVKATFDLCGMLGRKTFFYAPIWSPDSKKIAFYDKALNLYVLTLETKSLLRVDSDLFDHPERSLDPAWSPDSKWLAYTRRLDNQIRAVFLYSLEEASANQVTDGMSDAISPVFSRDGKNLFFAASTNWGLNAGWLDMSSYERPVTRSLYLVVLSKDDSSPLAPESDEEKGDEKPPEEKDASKKADASKADAVPSADSGAAPTAAAAAENEKAGEPPAAESEKTADGKGDKKEEEGKKKPVVVKVDLEGIGQRILALPAAPREYYHLQCGETKLFFLEYYPGQGLENMTAAFHLYAYDFKERKTEIFLDRVGGYWVSADGKKLLYRPPAENRYCIVEIEKKDSPNGWLNMDGLEMQVDPRAEWRQMFREAWRIHRDFFYDAEMHGLDWDAAYQKYLPFLEHVGHRDDLSYLLAELSGELVVGHAYVGEGDQPSVDPVPVGLLGADYEVTPEGFFRFARVISGVNWHPELRAPLTEPGVNVKAGEYLLAVNGVELRAPEPVYRLFEKTAGKITDLLVSPTTDPAAGRTVSVRPLYSETALRHWDWVEGNRQKVSVLSGGRVAYVYMANTAVEGYTSFNRYYFSQLDKEAVVLDERFNGGGSVADYVIDLLDRPVLSYWATREGRPFASPNASIFGPRVMIINELAGSGGDAMPLYFRRRGLGKLVGQRTWGGLVGIYDYPVLMDGGGITSPRMAIFSPDGRWEVENEGVAPDVEVEMSPKLVIAGRDPQLEKAVEIVLAELEANPPPRPQRPAPAGRARR
jgi:tricorn protease